MQKATLSDLELESWLRKREKGEIVWTTRDGAEIPINEMTDTHLNNTISLLAVNEEFGKDYIPEYDPALWFD